MATLYVQEQGAQVRKKDNQVLVTKDGVTLREVPMAKLDLVVLMGRGVQMSTALLIDLTERGIPVTLTNQQGSHFYGMWTAGPSRFGALRAEQTRLVQTPARALECARWIVQAKLANQRALLAAMNWPATKAAIGQIEDALRNLVNAGTMDAVRGYEGAAAAAYFGAWRVSIPPAWSFAGRAYYPPPDPVNALLSFGYTLALHDMLTAIHLTGLDPYLGTFHALETGRPSLALDLLEEFRPLLVDRPVLDLIRTNAITRAQFERPSDRPGAIYLNASGRARFIERYQALLQSQVRVANGEQTSLRRVLLLQAQTFARVVRGEQERYVGFTP